MNSENSVKTAAIVVIGNEILSGRTKDRNIGWLAEELSKLNIQVAEVRIVRDRQEEIVAAVNELRARFDYVFTTGGIGPTHDDITADAIAVAFGVGIDHHPEAVALLKNYYAKDVLNEARLRMARLPDGAMLINNPVSAAPGFKMENVYVMAGVPDIMQTMFGGIKNELIGGAPIYTETVESFSREGDIADRLTEIQNAYPDTEIGSYPCFKNGQVGTSLVVRGESKNLVVKVANLLREVTAEK